MNRACGDADPIGDLPQPEPEFFSQIRKFAHALIPLRQLSKSNRQSHPKILAYCRAVLVDCIPRFSCWETLCSVMFNFLANSLRLKPDFLRINSKLFMPFSLPNKKRLSFCSIIYIVLNEKSNRFTRFLRKKT